MLLNDQQIQARQLVQNAVESHYRPAGYDVTVGEIIGTNGETIGCDHELPPQGIAWVVSQERIQLPNDVLAYATIRTELCKDGVLALNIGIIDPGWNGPVSTVLVNFGKKEFDIKKGDKFLRLTFHQHEASMNVKQSQDNSKYVDDVKSRARRRFGRTFLNLDARFADAQRKALWKNLPLYGSLLAGLGLVLGAMTLFFSLWATWRAPHDIRAAIEDSDALAAQAIQGRDAAMTRQEAQRLLSLEQALKLIDCKAAQGPQAEDFDPSRLVLAAPEECKRMAAGP